jgi:signal transduction histidine kinase
VAKHAKTDSAIVECRCPDRRIVVRVSDSGVGYDPAAVPSGPHRGLGLISVRERLSLIGGSVEMRSTPGGGTAATLTAPLIGNESLAAERGA